MTLSFENGIKSMLEQMDAPISSFFSSCVHCGLCAQACLYYTETGDPKYTPIHRLEPLKKLWRKEFTLFGRIGGMVGLVKGPTEAEMREWEELIYDSCTMCGRCSMVCPVGNDITYMIRKIREGYSAAGIAPDSMKKASATAITSISPIGIKFQMVERQAEKQSAEVGIPIELDKKGADYLVILSSMEIMGFPEVLGALAKMFKQAGVTWTISSTAYEATNIGIQMGNKDVARHLVQRIVDSVHDLDIKKGIISPECGHAYQAIRWEGPNLIGKEYDFEVIHIVELLEKLVAEGKIKLNGEKYGPKITYHDPCQLNRRGGLDEPARKLINRISDNFVEMSDPGKMNWCCGGGGGVTAVHRAEDLRYKVFSKKKKQLDAVRPDELMTTCANCRNVIEEALDEYEMDLPVISLVETLAEFIEEDQTPVAEGDQ